MCIATIYVNVYVYLLTICCLINYMLLEKHQQPEQFVEKSNSLLTFLGRCCHLAAMVTNNVPMLEEQGRIPSGELT